MYVINVIQDSEHFRTGAGHAVDCTVLQSEAFYQRAGADSRKVSQLPDKMRHRTDVFAVGCPVVMHLDDIDY